jgi:hypothetical protein
MWPALHPGVRVQPFPLGFAAPLPPDSGAFPEGFTACFLSFFALKNF